MKSPGFHDNAIVCLLTSLAYRVVWLVILPLFAFAFVIAGLCFAIGLCSCCLLPMLRLILISFGLWISDLFSILIKGKRRAPGKNPAISRTERRLDRRLDRLGDLLDIIIDAVCLPGEVLSRRASDSWKKIPLASRR